MQKLGMSLLACLSLAGIACDDGAIDKSEQAVKCGSLCQVVDDCTGRDNSTDCRKECVNRSSNDDFEEQVDTCFDCVDGDNSCSENLVNCSSECAGVVAISST